MSNYKALINLATIMDRLKSKVEFMRGLEHELDPDQLEKLTKILEKALQLRFIDVKIEK